MPLNARDPEAVVQVIYKTAEKTFDGPIGGYMTLDGSEDSGNNAVQPVAQPQTRPARAPQGEGATQASAPVQTTQVAEATAVATSSQDQTPLVAPAATTARSEAKAIPSSAESISANTKSALAAKKPTEGSESTTSQVSSQITGLTPTQDASTASPSYIAENAVSSSSSTPGASVSRKSDGMSGGAKAGLAIGILLAIGLVLGMILFCYRRKKKQQQQQQSEAYQVADDEKSIAPDTGNVAAIGRTASVRTTSTAPRLSLRPVTEFLPDLAGRRKSGNALAAPSRNLGPADAMNEKISAQNQFTNLANPFGDHAEPSEKSIAARNERSVVPGQAQNLTNPFGNHAEALDRPMNGDYSLPADAPVPAPLRIGTPTPEGSSYAAGAALAAAGVPGPKADLPQALSLGPNRPSSPAPTPGSAGTEFSMSSATPSSVANGPPSNVHRVQLDFKPSMDDELALRAGQLVRLLHEYDDGWALCIRLDRSQQGVAPRTCLSARPVKPRPKPNAQGPAPRGPPPPGMFGPGQQRPMSPLSSGRGSPGPFDRTPRGMSPDSRPAQRSMSPGPYGGGPQRPSMPPPGRKRRSNSASEFRDRRASPPGPSPMNPNAQKVPIQLQAVTAPDQALPTATVSQPSSMPARKPVPGQAV
ncbi:MAG: hypothetical protein Q9211_002160 [Gyalolechia sp. 1 TL-2023]